MQDQKVNLNLNVDDRGPRRSSRLMGIRKKGGEWDELVPGTEKGDY